MSAPAPALSVFVRPRHKRLWTLVAARTGNEDLAHDSDHVLRVYRWSVQLAEEEGVDVDLAGAAALVHDLVNIPKESPDRPLGGEQSAAASRGLLDEAGYSTGEVASVVEAVRTCSWSRGRAPTSMLGAVLQDADRLDAIGAIGIARNFTCAQSIASRRAARGEAASRLYDPVDVRGRSGRSLDDVCNAVDHYELKLLRLRDCMHTAAARMEAEHRHGFMEKFLVELEREVGS